MYETWRECRSPPLGEGNRGEFSGDGEAIREEKRRSKGRNEGVGLLKPGLDALDGRILLLGDENTEFWKLNQSWIEMRYRVAYLYRRSVILK